MLGIRLNMAASTSCGRLVAPMIITRQSGSDTSPSQKLINWVFIIAVASWSVDVLDRKNESSKNDRKGAKKLFENMTNVKDSLIHHH